MRQYILLGVGSVVWGALVFAVATRVHFPEEAIINRARWEGQNATDGQMLLDVENAKPWRMSGLTLSLIHISEPTRPY